MECPKCGVELRIQSAYEEMAAGMDECGEALTSYIVQEYMCVNGKCEDYLRVVDTRRTRI